MAQSAASSREQRVGNTKRLTSVMRKGGRRFSTRIREFPSFQSDARSQPPRLRRPSMNACSVCQQQGLKSPLYETERKK